MNYHQFLCDIKSSRRTWSRRSDQKRVFVLPSRLLRDETFDCVSQISRVSHSMRFCLLPSTSPICN